MLAGDSDSISSEWLELHRNSPDTRSSFTVRISQLNDDRQAITRYAKVIYFFVHEFQSTERMLAYVQIYYTRDISLLAGCTQDNKIIRHERSGALEVLEVTAIDEGVGIMKVAERQYIIVRRRMLLDIEEDDPT